MNLSNDIAEFVFNDIVAGKYLPATPLPSLRKLARRYNASVTTVRSALNILKDKNKIVSYQGKGCFVRALRTTHNHRLILILSRPGKMYETMQEDILLLKSEDKGVCVVFESINQEPEKLQEAIEHMIANGLDTIFLNGITIDELSFLEKYLFSINIYVFFYLSHRLAHPDFIFGVFSDWHHGGYIGTRHLIDCGCKKILAILSSPGDLQDDFKLGIIAAGMDSCPEENISFIDDFPPSSMDENFKLLAKHLENGVDGIFCFTHSIAFKVYDYLKEHQYRIPEDIAVMVYYDSDISLEFSPPLTSISVCPELISSELLRMYRRGEKQVVIVKPKLIKRNSTLGFLKNSKGGIIDLKVPKIKYVDNV